MGKATTARSDPSAYATQDPFAFGADEAQMQSMQNIVTMMTAPWAAFIALSSEMTRDALRLFR